MAIDDRGDRPVGRNGSEPVGERVRIYCRGRVWHATYQAGGKQHRVSLGTTSKKAAQKKALRIDAELSTGTWRPAPEPATVAATITAYTSYLRAEERAPKTLVKYEKVFERVAQLATERKIKDVSGLDLGFVDAYKQKRHADGAQPKTRYTEAVIIRQLVNFALTRNLVERDPLRGLKLAKPRPTKQPCWTRPQVLAILAASPPEIRPALTLLCETGLRFGELAWLTWDDIDLKRGLIHIRPKEGWRLKTGDQRTFPMSGLARAVLQSLPRRDRWVVTMPPTGSTDGGRQWTERKLLGALKKVLKAVGLDGKIHTFRHTFISHALLTGVPVAVVRRWVGHVDPRVIDAYTHVHDQASQAAMQRLTDADVRLQKSEESQDGPESGSAQNQHTDREVRDA
jgi:integrase